MTWKLPIATGLSLLVLSACALFSKAHEANLYQVHLGQSPQELTDAIGAPDSKETDGSQDKWHYRIYADDNRRAYPYTAVFENGTLTNWYFDAAHGDDGPDPRGGGKGAGRTRHNEAPGEPGS